MRKGFKWPYYFIFMFIAYSIGVILVLAVLLTMILKIILNKKCLVALGVIFILAGSLFASYDMFPCFNNWNNRHIKLCSDWNSLIQEIYPHTTGAKVKIGDIKPFVTFKQGEPNFERLFSVIYLNYNVTLQDVSHIIVTSSMRRQVGDMATQVDSIVYLKNNVGNQELIGTPDILVSCIKHFRQNWFLKWGLVLIAFGSFLNLIGLFIPNNQS